MILMLMGTYIIFIIIGIRKNKKNYKEYQKKKYFSLIVLGIVNSILMLHGSKPFNTIENWGEFQELFFLLSIAISLIALLLYVNDIETE